MRKLTNSMPISQRAFASVAEAKDYLNTSISRVYEHIHAGELVAVKDGRSTRITTESLLALAKQIATGQQACGATRAA